MRVPATQPAMCVSARTAEITRDRFDRILGRTRRSCARLLGRQLAYRDDGSRKSRAMLAEDHRTGERVASAARPGEPGLVGRPYVATCRRPTPALRPDRRCGVGRGVALPATSALLGRTRRSPPSSSRSWCRSRHDIASWPRARCSSSDSLSPRFCGCAGCVPVDAQPAGRPWRQRVRRRAPRTRPRGDVVPRATPRPRRRRRRSSRPAPTTPTSARRATPRPTPHRRSGRRAGVGRRRVATYGQPARPGSPGRAADATRSPVR